MVFARTHQEIDAARRGIARIGKVSDNIVGVGPFGIGIDGILAWVPGIGDLYSLAAGGMLVMLGLRSRAPMHVILQVVALVGARTAVGAAAIPLLGPFYPVSGAVVDLFRGHKMSADMLVKTIDNTLFVEGRRSELKDDPALAAEVEQAKREGLRIVYLG